ncbi:MAG: hypothetical protein WAW96_10335 [Alphaproteobacteria bacterium]
MNISLVRILAAGATCLAALCAARIAAAAEPCKLVTAAQLKAALGADVGPGAPIGTTGCEWATSDSRTRVTITVWNAANWALSKSPVPDITKTPAPGIGDDAFYTVVQTATSLSVKKGKSYIVVHAYGVGDLVKQQSVEKTIALDALPNL